MLDDLKYIHDRDAQDALGIAEKQSLQYHHAFHFEYQNSKPIKNIVVGGMGGSALAAKALYSWPGLSVPLRIVQDYDLPKEVNQQTLLIVSSYSGDTEEEISLITQALLLPQENQPMIVVISSGGTLKSLAEENNLPFVQLPINFQPRMTFGYQLRALIEVLEQAKITEHNIAELEEAADWLAPKLNDWISVVPIVKNSAKQLALELMGRSIVIYSGPLLSIAAYKWKINFNENAKTVAWCNQYPEFNHNEFIGWTSHPIDKPYAIVDLRSNLDRQEIQQRFITSDRLLSGKRPAPEVVTIKGNTHIQQLLWTIAFGDFVSLYVALLNGLNPTPVDLIEKLKVQLRHD